MQTIITCLLVFLGLISAFGQETKSVLFIGNSYIYYNDMPETLKNIALSMGDNVIHDSSAPGGATLQGHSTNQTTLQKIMQGNWNYVVLQEQSQRPALSLQLVQTNVFPFASTLNNLINQNNPCVETVFYTTWGRKNGDSSNCANFPAVCTYEGMDNLLTERYNTMAVDNNAIVSPVGPVWRYIRTNYPTIELYDPDESHPSAAGSYAAACAFYTAIFRKNPLSITFNSGLSAVQAQQIRQAVKVVLFDALLNWKIGSYDPNSNFSFSTSNNVVNFTNLSTNATTYSWDFGDGNSSTATNPSHSYTATGNYTVVLSATKCGMTKTKSIVVPISSLNNLSHALEKVQIYPNPFDNHLIIKNINVALKAISFYNVLGHKIDVLIDKNANDMVLYTSNLSSGFYYVVITDEYSNQTKQKVIKL